MAKAADDIRESLQQQVSTLTNEIARISKALASDSAEAFDDAYEEGRGRARAAARQVRDQAHVAADVARENPGTTATVLATVGLLGAVAGLAIASACASDRRR